MSSPALNRNDIQNQGPVSFLENEDQKRAHSSLSDGSKTLSESTFVTNSDHCELRVKFGLKWPDADCNSAILFTFFEKAFYR